jgi:phage-related protein
MPISLFSYDFVSHQNSRIFLFKDEPDNIIAAPKKKQTSEHKSSFFGYNSLNFYPAER